MLVIVNPYHRSVTIDGVEVVQKIIEFPNELNHLSTISCTYDDSSKKITQVHDLHRFTSNFIEREYFFEHLPVFIEWYYKEKQAQIEDETKKEQYKQDIEDAYNKTVQAGNTAVTNINTDKTEALNAIESSKTTTLNVITSKRAEALNAIQDSKITVLNEITDTTNTSINNITNTTNSGLSNLNSKENEALNKIATDKAEALSAILSDRQSSLDAINSSINKATTQADRSKTEADRSKYYADQMQAVADVRPATKEQIGLVIIGDNVDVDDEGVISIPKSAKATQDEEGNEVPEVAGVVTTGKTITNIDGKLDVNLGDSLETDEDGKINVKLDKTIIKNDDGSLNVNTDTTLSVSANGKIGVNLGDTLSKTDDGKINANIATSASLGLVKIGKNLTILADGTLSIGESTKTQLGLVMVGDDLDVDSTGKITTSSTVVKTTGGTFTGNVTVPSPLYINAQGDDKNGGSIYFRPSANNYGGFYLSCYEGLARILLAASNDGKQEQCILSIPRRQGYLQSVEVGVVVFFAKSQVRSDYLACNGAAISRTTYSALFNVIGTTFGAGDGSTTFNLPNLMDMTIWGGTSVGTKKTAGLPNITGTFQLGGVPAAYGGGTSGAFIRSQQSAGSCSSTTGDKKPDLVSIDASKSSSIYGSSTTVQPPALTLLPMIRYR